MPSVELFDRTMDLNDHLDVYKAQMYVQDVDDATCIIYFPATLKGIAQKWFNVLPNGSVASFFQLAELFSAHFIASKREKDQHSLGQNTIAVGEGVKRVRTTVYS